MSEVIPKLHIDKVTDKVTLSHSQDVTSALEANKSARKVFDSQSKMGDMQRVASIPAAIAIEWMNEGINVMAPNREDYRRMAKKLNSPDYQYLRTGGGRL